MVPTDSTPLKAEITQADRTYDSEDDEETLKNNHTTFFTSPPIGVNGTDRT